MRLAVLCARVLCAVVLVLGAGVLGAEVLGAQGQQPPAPPSTTILLGQVVDADSDQPVPDVTVTVATRLGAARAGGSGAVPGMAPGANSMRLLTGADGKFVVRDLPVGNVQLSTTAAGYVNGGFGQARPGAPVAPFIVTAEEHGGKVAQVKIRIWRTAAITGMVTDERGEPRPGVNVTAMRRTFVRGQPRLGAIAAQLLGPTASQSDDRGMYRISGLAPGDYVVVSPQTQLAMPAGAMEAAMKSASGGDMQGLVGAGMEMAMSGGAMLASGMRVGDLVVGTQGGQLPVPQQDGRLRVYTTRYFPNVDVPSQATVITLKSGEERSGVDLALPLTPTVSVSGVVMGPLGPVPNVGVRLRHASETLVSDGSADVAAANTRADGSFLMPAVPTGNYVVRVMRAARPTIPAAQLAMMPEELKGMMGALGTPGPLDSMTLFAEVPLPLERDVAGLTVTLTTGATLAGRVVTEGEGAPPLQGMSITLTSISGDWASGPMGMLQTGSTVRVNEDGTFTTAGYPPGRYTVGLSGRIPTGWALKSALVNGREAAWDPFELESRDLSNVVVTLTDKRSTISGTTQSATGGAPAAASVVIFPAAWREWIAGGMNTQLARIVRTPAAGTFSIAGMPPRDYLMLAVETNEAPDIQDPAMFDALARAATSVTVGEGETKTVTLRLVKVQR